MQVLLTDSEVHDSDSEVQSIPSDDSCCLDVNAEQSPVAMIEDSSSEDEVDIVWVKPMV